MAIKPRRDGPDNCRQQPIYWFAILDMAIDRGDHATAAEAQRELRRLGVDVHYGRPDHQTAGSKGNAG